MKARTRRRRRIRNVLLAVGLVLVVLGITVFMTSASAGKPEMKSVFYVSDSATEQPIANASLSVTVRIPGIGSAPLSRVTTDSNGSASIAAPSSIFSVDVTGKGYQEYFANNLPAADTYRIHLGRPNVTGSIEAINSTRGRGFTLPLPLGQFVGAVAGATGALVLAVAVIREFRATRVR